MSAELKELLPPEIIIQIRDLVHEYGNTWNHTTKEENDLTQRLIKFYRKLPPPPKDQAK